MTLGSVDTKFSIRRMVDLSANDACKSCQIIPNTELCYKSLYLVTNEATTWNLELDKPDSECLKLNKAVPPLRISKSNRFTLKVSHKTTNCVCYEKMNAWKGQHETCAYLWQIHFQTFFPKKLTQSIHPAGIELQEYQIVLIEMKTSSEVPLKKILKA